MQYFLFGPYPPILGGVSVFNYRYIKILRDAGYDVKNIDLSTTSKLRRYLYYIQSLVCPRKSIYHLDKFVLPLAVVLLLRPFRSVIILHNHSCRYIDALGRIERHILRLFLNRIDECIFISSSLLPYYTRNRLELPCTVTIQSPFLPPPIEEEDIIWKTYDTKMLHFVTNRKPLIIANASKLVFYKGIDLYGLDMCVDLISKLTTKYPQIGLLFALAEIGEMKYFEESIQRINKANIATHFFFMTGQKELWPLFRKCDLMIRPTYSDGYGISVAEALFFNCPAIASDVSDRPKGTILFKNRDFDDLLSKVNDVLSAPKRAV